MAGARRYAFDTEFAPDGAILSDAPKRLAPEEIEAAVAAAYERGKQDALAVAEREAAAALATLAATAKSLTGRIEAERDAMRADAVRLAMAAANKISGAALEAFGAERALAAVEAALDALRHHPRLIVKLNPAQAEILRPRIEAARESHDYGGAIIVRAEPSVRAASVVIDWSDGVIGSSPQDIEERVRQLMEAALSTPHSQGEL
ncbi:MAG: hypothetical protein KF700_02440 [Hyphomonadaceae bacterium]|nr:hypothetical protein [Hyphomonadaceae bacterium]